MLSAACAIGALMLAAPELGDGPHTIVDTGRPGAYGAAQDAAMTVRPGSDGARPTNIFTACPALLTRLPARITPATDQDRQDAGRSIARPSEPPVRSVVVYRVDAPVFDRTGRRATVTMTYVCPGLCGGGVAFDFRRIGHGWRRDGEARPLWVS